MSQLFIEECNIPEVFPAIRAGRTGLPQVLTKGGEYALGNITFSDQPAADSNIVLNGVYVEFSASASDATADGTVADPLLVNIKGSLALTLDELIVVLNATANADISVATYTEDNTHLYVTYDTIGTDANDYTLVAEAASNGTVSGANLTGGAAAVPLSVNTENNDIQLTDSQNQYFTLPDASADFTKKTIALTAKGSGNAIVTPTNLTGATTITFDADGEIWTGIFINGSWKSLVTTATEA